MELSSSSDSNATDDAESSFASARKRGKQTDYDDLVDDNVDFSDLSRKKKASKQSRDKERQEEYLSALIAFMDEYNLSREDFDDILEVTTFKGTTDTPAIAAPVKSAFTRALNSERIQRVDPALAALQAMGKKDTSVATFVVGRKLVSNTAGSAKSSTGTRGKKSGVTVSARNKTASAESLAPPERLRRAIGDVMNERLHAGKSFFPLRRVLHRAGLARLMDPDSARNTSFAADEDSFSDEENSSNSMNDDDGEYGMARRKD